MSIIILQVARSFVEGKLSAHEFANSFMVIWKIERDNSLLQQDESNLSECLSSIFRLADLYNPASDRRGYEIDDEQLRVEVGKLLEKFSL